MKRQSSLLILGYSGQQNWNLTSEYLTSTSWYWLTRQYNHRLFLMHLNIKERLWGKNEALFCCRVTCSELVAIEEINLRSKAGNIIRKTGQDLVLVQKLNWILPGNLDSGESRRGNTTTLLLESIRGSEQDGQREGSSPPQGLPHPPSHLTLFRNLICLQLLTFVNNLWHSEEESQELKSCFSSFTQMTEDSYWMGKGHTEK